MYVELFRKGAENDLVGHIQRIFADGVTPPVPEAGRIVRIEVSDRNRAQLRNLIESGVGRIKLNDVSNAVKNQLRTTRTFSATFAQIAARMAVDRDPATVATRKVRQRKDSPSKPAGTIWAIDPTDPNPRFRCIADPDTWMDASEVNNDIAQQATINGQYPFHFEDIA